MNQTVSPARVRELVLMAKELRTEEIQLLIAATALEAAQNAACSMIEDEPQEYEHQRVYPGCDLWEHAAFIAENLAHEDDLARVVNKYGVHRMFDIYIQRELVATPVKV